MNRPIVAVAILLALSSGSAAEEPVDLAGQLKQQQEAVEKLAAENSLLRAKLGALEGCSIHRDELIRRNFARLQAIAGEVKPQRQTISGFEGYIKWMSGSLSSYSRYVEAGSAAAALAKYLPIPYAGQAGAFAKFVAHFALSLNAASNAIDKYLKTSQQFVGRVEAVDGSKPLNPAEIAAIGRLADEQLLRDMNEARGRLETTSNLSSSALAFFETLNSYAASTDEYWAKTKQFVTRKEADAKEKSYLSETVNVLKTQAASFNNRLRLFDDATQKTTPLIKSLGVYEELVREMSGKSAATSL